jgi:hypothetical protein
MLELQVNSPKRTMNMRKLLPAAALAVLCLAAAATAHARGGWDGNGLSASGFDMCSLDNAQCADSLEMNVVEARPLAHPGKSDVAEGSGFELISVPVNK